MLKRALSGHHYIHSRVTSVLNPQSLQVCRLAKDQSSTLVYTVYTLVAQSGK